MAEYKHIFFDLDHTLWDFSKNSQETIRDLYENFQLNRFGFKDFEDFYSTYYKVNDQYWRFYRQGKVTKAQLRVGRFRDTLLDRNVNHDELSEQMAEFYVSHGPYKTNLLPGAKEILDYLAKSYELHLITNGFKEVQHIKLRESGLRDYFDELIISEEVGFQKPHPEIFRHANNATSSVAKESIIIGDNLEADVLGGKRAGWGHVFFNPEENDHQEEIQHEIKELRELDQIL